MFGVDDGIVNGNLNFADIMFLVAFILSVLATIVRIMVRPVPIDGVLMSAAIACLSLGFLVL